MSKDIIKDTEIPNNNNNDDEQLSHSSTETSGSNKITKPFHFLIFGIGSLLAWNVILSDIDFFDYFLKDTGLPSPTLIFPFLNFALNITFQFIIVCTKKKYSYRSQLILTLLLLMLTMILLPLVVLIFNPTTGYILSCVIIFLQGLVSAICSSSFFGLVSYFKTQYIVMLSTGQGVSGILMNVIKYVLLLTVPRPSEGDKDYRSKERKAYIIEAIIYFSIAFLILLGCLVSLLISYANKDFIKDLRTTDEMVSIMKGSGKQHKRFIDIEVDAMHKQPLLLSESNNKEITGDNDVNNNNNTYSFISLIKTLIEINLLIMTSYVITFTVFPSALLKPNLFGLSTGWKFNTLTTLFNVFDTLGRKIISSFKPNKRVLYITTILRSILIVLIPLNYFIEVANMNIIIVSVFLTFNSVFLGVTNGICTSLSYALAPRMVEDKLKGKSGASVSFFNILGIFIGTCLAFGMIEVINLISAYIN